MKKLLLFTLLISCYNVHPQMYFNPDAVMETDTAWEDFSPINYYANQAPLEKTKIQKNKIRSLVVKSYKFDMYENKRLRWYTEYIFDSANNLVSKKGYNKKNRLVENHIFEYNDSNKIISYVSKNKQGRILRKNTAVYNNQGLLASEVAYRKGGTIPKNKITAKYNNNGKIIQLCYYRYTYDGDEFLVENYVTTYSEDEKKGETKLYNSNGDHSNTWSFRCPPQSSSGNIRLKDSTEICIKYEYMGDSGKTKTLIYNNSKNRVRKTELKYDSKGNLTEWKDYNRKDIVRKKYISIYDSFNNNCESKTYKRGGPKIKKRYFMLYDNNRRLKEYHLYKGENKLANSYFYDYNEKGLPAAITNYKKKDKKYCLTEYSFEFFE